MAIVKVRGTLKDGCFTPNLKRKRIDDVGNFPKGCGSFKVQEQRSEHEDRNSSVNHSMVKTFENFPVRKRIDEMHVPLDKRIDEIHAEVMKTAPRETFPSPERVLNDYSIQSKEHLHTSKVATTFSARVGSQGLSRRSLSDHHRPNMAIRGKSNINHQRVSCLEEKDGKKVKKDLDILHDILTKSNKQNWYKEYQHTTIVSGKDSIMFASRIQHSVLQRSQQLSNHQQKLSASPAVVEHERSKVKRALNAYKEILTQSNKQNCWNYIRAAMHLKKQGEWINTTKKIGAIRGVKVGDRFRHRAQLTLVGLHRQFTCGIDYLKRKDGKILATSIVDSGRYTNNMQSSDILIYSGQGGKSLFEKAEPTNQTLKGGNLALSNSKEEGTPIRVIRKLKLSTGWCYVYYGLYTVEKVMKEREIRKWVYKFRLRRNSGQPKLTFDSS
ncbi:hypothetical protein M0R45_036559 [Rubus argutus]|uniref:YDG domain-containing protein n=1 Tax=Rubus argutus TaxID=59490 RepID=A0AAW1W0K3_RUBAR